MAGGGEYSPASLVRTEVAGKEQKTLWTFSFVQREEVETCFISMFGDTQNMGLSKAVKELRSLVQRITVQGRVQVCNTSAVTARCETIVHGYKVLQHQRACKSISHFTSSTIGSADVPGLDELIPWSRC